MSRHVPIRAAAAALAAVLAFAAAAAAQAAPAPLAIARTLVAAAAAERDDADAIAAQLLAAASAHADSSAAGLLLAAATEQLPRLQHPAALLPAVQQLAAGDGHGALVQAARELLLSLRRAAAGSDGKGRELPAPPADLADPWRDWTQALLAIGPFGDSAEVYLDAPYAPELRFPALNEPLAGRFGPVQARVVQRLPFRSRIELEPQANGEPGCFYGLCRVAVAQEISGFAEVACDGALQVFANGVEIGRMAPWLEPGPPVRRFPLQLPAGDNQLLLKTCLAGRAAVALRLVDGRGRPLPGLRELAADAPLQPPPAAAGPRGGAFQDGLATLQQAAASATGADRAALLVAQLLAARRLDRVDQQLAAATALLAAPPTEPAAALALAEELRSLQALPEELRLQRARELEDAAIAALPAGHHRALLARVNQLGVEDKREQGLRLLRQAMQEQRAGAETFALALELVQRLEFRAEQEPLLRQWIAARPRDLRPRLELARRLRADGAPAAALLELCAALRAHPDAERAAGEAAAIAADLGDAATAERCRLLAEPFAGIGGQPTLAQLQAEAGLARRRGDRDRHRQLLAAIAAHPDADADDLEHVGDRWLQLGDEERALAAWRQCLQLDPSRHALRRSVARLSGAPAPGADLLPFRRDGDAAIAAFQASDREAGASTTVLIDQMLVEVLEDGSRIEEVHQLRRINDLQGVEAMKQPDAPARADELLLLRTVAGGKTFVPSRTEGSFAMVRLEPGAFVEWRYRDYAAAPEAEPWRTPQFTFASKDEPYLVSEYVLILPPHAPGELRARGFAGPTEQRTLADGRRLLVFRREAMPRLPQERNTPPLIDLAPVAQWGEDAEPAAFARTVRASLQQQTRPTPVVEREAQAIVAAAGDDRGALLAAIHDWVQREIASGPDNGPTAALLRKKGQRLLTETALLRAAGFTVDYAVAQPERTALADDPHPLFVDTDRWGLPCMRVAGPGGPVWLFADGPRYLPLGLVPGRRVGAQALVATAAGAELVQLPATHLDTAQNVAASGTVTLQADGNVVFDGDVLFADQAAYGLAEQLRDLKADVRKLAARQLAQRFFPDWRLLDAQLADLEPPGRPPRVHCRCSRALLQRDGDRCLLPLPLPPSRLLQAFGDRPGRELPLRLTNEVRIDWQVVFDPGPAFALAQLPEPVLLQHGPLTLAVRCALQPDGRLRIDEHALVRAGTIEQPAFGGWMQALQAVVAAENANLVLVPRPQ